jgi:hypothetical protein
VSDLGDPVDNDELGWGFIAVVAVCVVAGLTVVPWLAAQGLLYLVDHGGWLRAGAGAVVAAACAVYVIRQRRSP